MKNKIVDGREGVEGKSGIIKGLISHLSLAHALTYMSKAGASKLQGYNNVFNIGNSKF